MRKILIALAIILVIAGCNKGVLKPAFSEGINLPDLINKLPALNQSVIFSLDENKLDYASSVTLVKLWNDKISIDLGYSPSVEALGLVSFKLIEVKDYIKFPILDLVVIEPFVYAGARRIENLKEFGEWDYGVGCKIVSIKF